MFRPIATSIREEGEPLFLLHYSSLKGFGFLINGGVEHTTRFSITFKTGNKKIDNRHFHLACACCPTETLGLSEPNFEIDHGKTREVFRESKRPLFHGYVTAACVKNDISVLFMREARYWQRRYGEIPGVRVVEADQFLSEMSESYGRQFIMSCLSGMEFHDREKKL